MTPKEVRRYYRIIKSMLKLNRGLTFRESCLYYKVYREAAIEWSKQAKSFNYNTQNVLDFLRAKGSQKGP